MPPSPSGLKGSLGRTRKHSLDWSYLKLRPHFLGPAGIQDWGSSLGGICVGSLGYHLPHCWLHFTGTPLMQGRGCAAIGGWLMTVPLTSGSVSSSLPHVQAPISLWSGLTTLVNPQVKFNRPVYQHCLRQQVHRKHSTLCRKLLWGCSLPQTGRLWPRPFSTLLVHPAPASWHLAGH